MALIKKIIDVIKEELFDSKPKTTAKKTTYAQIDAMDYARLERERQQIRASAAIRKTEEVKKAESEKKQQPNKADGHKKQQADKPVKKLGKLPDKTLALYEEAKAAAQKGSCEAALELYDKAFRLVLEYACEKLEISYKKMSLKQMLRKVCKNMCISNKNGSRFHILLSVLQGNVEYNNQKKRLQRVVTDMEIFVNCIQTGFANGRGPEKKKTKAKTGSNKKKNANKKPDANKKQDTNKLSFKARESVIKGEPFDINKEYPRVTTYLDKAKKNQKEKYFPGALQEIRKALEVIVKAMCRKLAVELEEREKLDDMIKKLVATGKLSDGHSKSLNNARWLGNMGSHDYDKRDPGESDVTKAFAEIKKVIKMFETFMSGDRDVDNKPLEGTNEYYSPQRKYYGRWTDCFTYGGLMMIDDYVMLKEKADKGDIQAMLDIASGFFENPICWTNESLIYLKKYREPLYYPDPCDARYYYWILRACYTAYFDWKDGKPLPLRYLANTLLEGIKFIYMHKRRLEKLTSRQIVNRSSDQFSQARSLFGEFPDYYSYQEWYIEMLTAMMKEYAGKNLFANVHKEKTVQDVEMWKI